MRPPIILVTLVSLAKRGHRVGDYWNVLLDQTKLSSVLGDRTAKSFLKHFGFESVSELLEHYPRRYASRGELSNLGKLPIGDQVSVVGEIEKVSTRSLRGRNGSVLEVVLGDGSETLTLTFFNQAWRQKELVVGKRGLFSGKVTAFNGKYQLAHPDYELFDEIDPSQAKAWAELPIPIYKSSGPLSTWKIQKSVEIVLESSTTDELLPPKLLSDQGLVSLADAIRQVHRPATQEQWMSALDSLRFHEAVVLQSQLEAIRQQYQNQKSTLRPEGALVAKFEQRLPFSFTAGQLEVSSAISDDLTSGRPMHRLLQGEVGSGKTVIAVRAALQVADTGGQVALLAPTEVLASQHFANIKKYLGDDMAEELGLALITGQQPVQMKKKTTLDLASGKCKFVIGTHALISENVSFLDLGLVIIDEQQRFGVSQREKLRQKAKLTPHLLAMTATPIPRTVAISIFGDLDLSTLSELPEGRKEISSHVVPVRDSALVARVWQRVAEEVFKGRQAFVVCPRIDAQDIDEAGPLPGQVIEDQLPMAARSESAAAVDVYGALQSNEALAGLRIGLLHGRLPAEEKSQVMEDFEAGAIDVLVSTTVIEVGVNVPNATVMVILDSDRFGISQLHQLRGRVGRGEHGGLCLLVTSAEQNSTAFARLEQVANTTDGFKLSEIDLEFRGEGDVLGTMQSGGKSSLKLLRVVKDAALIERARAIAQDISKTGMTPGLIRLLELQDARGLNQS